MKKIDGNFDFYPQGRVSLTSCSIDSGNITNRFSRAKFTRRENGKLVAYTAYLYSIPMQYQFNVEIRCDTYNTAMKIDEAFRKEFYKNKTYRINYNGTVCPVRVGFPETALQVPSGGSYTMGQAPNDTWHKVVLALQCETYQPVFDKYTERLLQNTVKRWGADIWVNRNQDEHRTGPLSWLTDFEDMILVCGQDIMLEWKYNYMDRDLLMVDLLFQEEGHEDDEQHLIASMDNHNFCHWSIPEDFLEEHTPIDVVIPNSDIVNVYTQPKIYIYADPTTKMVSVENVYVLNKGYFITQQPQVDCIIEYEDKNGEIQEVEAKLNLKNNMIDEFDPIEFKCFVFNGNVDSKSIRFILRDHNQTANLVVSPYITIV